MLLSNATDPADSAAVAAVLKKGPWSAAEDTVLVEYVNKNGEGNWNAVQRNTGLQRCGKSCRLRWANHLRPNLKKGAFSTEEERLIIHLHSKLGNKWARISSHLPGRTDNEIKNYWNTRVKRRLRQGLPLYPNQNPSISTQTPKITPFQSSSYPITFNQNPQITTNQNTLSLFNPISLPSSFLPLHHPPPTLPPHFIRHCPNTFSGRRTFSPPGQMGQYHLSSNGFGSGFGFDSGQVPLTRFGVEGFNFDNMSNFVELPSNQIVANNHDVVDDIEDNSNVGRAKSGLLDDLLQEAQIKMVNRGVKREREDCELDWDGLASENSISGTKKEQDPSQQMNLGNDDDLSNILDLIPSLVQVPGWCNNVNGGGESPVDQSAVSVLSTENNYDGFDNVPEPPPLTDLSPSDYDDDDGGDDWNPGSYNTWENLP